MSKSLELEKRWKYLFQIYKQSRLLLITYLQDEDLKQHNIFSICALEDRSTSGKLCSVFRYFADLFSSNSNSRLNYEPTERYSAKTEQDSVI